MQEGKLCIQLGVMTTMTNEVMNVAQLIKDSKEEEKTRISWGKHGKRCRLDIPGG